MKQFANSSFWRTIAVLFVLLIAVDVGHRLLGTTALPEVMPLAVAGSGSIIDTSDEGIITTNEDGTKVYVWGRLQGSPAGKTVVRFDVTKLAIDRLDLK